MAIRPRIRKRVLAVRRAADGSAFEKCEECGVMIAIALFDMHECGEKITQVKRFKCVSSCNNISKPSGSFEDEPRSPFIFFLEEFRESYGGNLVDASRICFNTWKNMSEEEQKPFRDRATEVDLVHSMKLKEEAKRFYKADDEADSKYEKVFTQLLESYDHEQEDSDLYDHFEHMFWERSSQMEY